MRAGGFCPPRFWPSRPFCRMAQVHLLPCCIGARCARAVVWAARWDGGAKPLWGFVLGSSREGLYSPPCGPGLGSARFASVADRVPKPTNKKRSLVGLNCDGEMDPSPDTSCGPHLLRGRRAGHIAPTQIQRLHGTPGGRCRAVPPQHGSEIAKEKVRNAVRKASVWHRIVLKRREAESERSEN